MRIVERVNLSLEHQIAALGREFEAWRTRTDANTPLEKHFSQVRTITGGLDGLLARATSRMAAGAVDERARTAVRGAHVLWDYFRSKLSLRESPALVHELRCFDELAWACYEPVLKAVDVGVVDPLRLKEPPLVFFSTDATPFARTREGTIVAAGLDTADPTIFDTAILSLPISLIGVPWFQHSYMPGAVVIAHEVGHAVANDLSAAAAAAGRRHDGVRPEIEEAVARLGLGPRAEGWGCWCHELFADAFAALCCGPAAAMALAEYLAGDPGALAGEVLPNPAGAARPDKGWDVYPTRQLRMRFNFELLRQLELADDGLKTEWEETYGTLHSMLAFDADLESVARALLTTPLTVFGGKSIRDVITFQQANLDDAINTASLIARGDTPTNNTSFRVIFAALALAYRRDPPGFVTRYVPADPPLAQRLTGTIRGGPRGVREALPAEAQPAREQAGAHLGDMLADLFMPPTL
jgi:hypothetical protein